MFLILIFPFVSYKDYLLTLDSPNDDEVEFSKMEDVVVNYQVRRFLNLIPSVTGQPEVIVRNSPLEAMVTFKDSPLTPLNEKYPNHNYVFTRKFYAELSSGGITHKDSTQHEIEVKDIEAPTFTKPEDVILTWDQELDSTNTYSPTDIKDNSNLPVEKRVSYVLREEEDSTKFYDAVWTLTDQFGNESSQTQKVTVDYTTDISKIIELPTEFSLSQNYPNPFNPTTAIEYSIPKNANGEKQGVRVVVYDFLGNKIATLVNKPQSAGFYSVNFNASNLSSGIYFYKIATPSFSQTKKMLLLK